MTDVTDSPVAEAHRLLVEAADALSAAAETGPATDADVLSVLTLCEGLTRRLDRLTLTAVAALARRVRRPRLHLHRRRAG